MDPFTQRILAKAEQRSKNLGVSKSAKLPLTEIDNTIPSDTSSNTDLESNYHFNNAKSISPEKLKSTFYKRSPNKKEVSLYPIKEQNRLQVSQRKIEIDTNMESSQKVRRQFSVDKENMDIEINITTGPNYNVQVEVQEQDIDNDEASADDESIKEKCPNNKIRDSSRNRLQRLGALYSNTNDLSSPIHRTEAKFHADTSARIEETNKLKKIPKLSKLTALANSINNWEDDTSHPDYRKPMSDSNANTNSSAIVIATSKKETSPTKSMTKNTKSLKWDEKVMNSLEAQGFQRRESSNTKLSYEYKKVSEKKNEKKTASSIAKNDESGNNLKIMQTNNKDNAIANVTSTVQNIKSGLVSGRTAVFENKAIENKQPIKKPLKDPAEMSLKERMQLFEKNKGEALVPKAPFALGAPINKVQDANKSNKSTGKQAQKSPSKTNDVKTDINLKDKIKQFGFGGSTISETNIKNDIFKQKKQDMDIIAQRYNKVENTIQSNEHSMPPPPPPPPMQSQGSYKRISPPTTIERVEDESKRQKLTSNRLYPVLSDLESTDTEMDNCTTATVSCDSAEDEKKKFNILSESPMEAEDSEDDDISNVSLGREILQHVQKNEMKNSNNSTQKKKEVRYADKQQYYEDSSFNSSEESAGMDDYLDEALEDESDVTDEYNNSNKYGTKSSNSFSYEKTPKKYELHQSITQKNEESSHPVTSELTVNNSTDDNMVTLVHTVSFYRKQQSNSNSVNNTPIRKVLHESKSKIEEVETSSYSDEDCVSTNSTELEKAYLVDEKIKKLLDEVCKQQQVIAQTSQALNLCAATIEFSGSSESVEGERHLLVATHRRQAALDEVQRLRVERTMRPVNSAKEKGRLTVKDICVPLRQDYIRKLSSDAISGHHLVCLLKYNENVLATKTVPTLPGLLTIKFPDVITLNNVYADFRITLEVYGMTAQREILPHEVKYHINLNKKSGSRTPRKKASDSRLIMPMVQSPGGPNVVRTPALVQYGFAIFSLKEIQRNSWTLTQVSGVSPLDGVINMKIHCELTVAIEYRGFLTMFEDISGFGAWHRRWCFLNGSVLNYWKYPDDQNKKTPMGSIDLNSCISPRIGTAPRDICARLNTMLLECQRPAQENDIESFLIIPKGKNTIVRYLLSADTKEERADWCGFLNKSLTLIRAWGTPQ